jgi:hypothetical protein
LASRDRPQWRYPKCTMPMVEYTPIPSDANLTDATRSAIARLTA